MSLLMDALKRAEQAKQQSQGGSASPGEALDYSANDPTPGSLPELVKLETLDSQFVVPPRPSSPNQPSASKGPETKSRTASAAGNHLIDERDHLVTLAIVAFGLLVAGLAAGYFWLQLKPSATPTYRNTSPLAGASRAKAAPEAAPEAAPRTPSELATKPATTPAPDIDAIKNTVLPNRPPLPADGGVPTPAVRSQPPTAPIAKPESPSLPAIESPIQVTSGRADVVDPAIAQGYRLLAAGDLAAAHAAYSLALQNDPRQLDALHGMAAIALQEGKAEQAMIAYQHILEINPNDAAAQAGIVNLNGQLDPVVAASRITALMAQLGDQPALNFALGNAYARQQRWSDAQAAYFNAVAGDTKNPDYLFNLAVSLDQMRQPRLAAKYYGEALTATQQRAGAFDREQVVQRLKQLER